MNAKDARRFYEQDLKKYNIANNKEFLFWLKESIQNGYQPFIEVDDLQKLIDNIAYWYELKYPNRELAFYEGIRHYDFDNMPRLSKVMNIKQLMYRLPDDQLNLIKCHYRSSAYCMNPVYNAKGKIVGHRRYTVVTIKTRGEEQRLNSACSVPYDIHLFVNSKSGIVNSCFDFKKYTNKDDILLDDLLSIIKDYYSNQFCYNDLEKCVNNHNYDLELRRIVLQLVALKLLYSRNTTPEKGFERAKRFISEFNKKIGLNLSTKEIEEAMNNDCLNENNCEQILVDYATVEKTSNLSTDNIFTKLQNTLKRKISLSRILLKNKKKN